MAGEIASAFVRIRPNLKGFKGEAEHGIKAAMRGLAGTGVPGLTRANEQLALFNAEQRRTAQTAVAASRVVRSAREQEARATVASAVAERRALQETLVQYRRLAASAKLSAESRTVANVQAAETAALLGVPLSRTEHHARNARSEIGKLERGALAGSGAFKGLGRNVAYSSTAFIGAYGLIGLVKKAITSQGDFLNQQVRSKTVFRGSADEILRWSKTANRELGFARSSALKTANTFGTLLVGAGVSPREAAKSSEGLSRVASAISLAAGEEDPERATAAIRTALNGRGRALRAYGIVLDDTAIKAKAAELGLVKTTLDPAKVRVAEQKVGIAAAQLAVDRADPKSSPIKIAKDVVALEGAQARLKKQLAGTSITLTAAQKAQAAYAIIMQQGQHYVDRYGASLNTAAGRSRKFHETVAEISEEVGHELYPSFKSIQAGITDYLGTLTEGGSRHRQFINSIRGVRSAAHAVYDAFRLGARVAGIATHAVGGLGNALKLLALLWGTNKIIAWGRALRASALAELVLGRNAKIAATEVNAAQARMALGFNRPIGKVGALKAALLGLPEVIGPISIAVAVSVIGGRSLQHFLTKPGGVKEWVQGHLFGKDVPKEGEISGDGLAIRRGGKWVPYFSTPGTEGNRARLYRDQEAAAERKKVKTAAKTSGSDTGKLYGDSLRDALRQKRAEIRGELSQVASDLADARREAAAAIADAVKQAAEAERSAILEAKSNLNSLGGSLADKINELLDAKGSSSADQPTGPLAKRLAALTKLIHQGKATPALIREAQRVEHELNAQQSAGDKKKRDVSRRVADLTDELNTGKISIAKFNREIHRLLRREGVSYKAAGKYLGVSFADGLKQAIRDVLDQAEAIAKTPKWLRRKGTGFEQEIIRPANVIAEQAKNIANVEAEQRKRIGELVKHQSELLKQAKAAGITAKTQRGKMIHELRKTNTDREKSARAPHRGGARGAEKPKADLTDVLLQRVVVADRQTLDAEKHQTDVLKQTDTAARAQRGTMISVERHQAKLLERLVHQGQHQNSILREVEKKLKRPRPSPKRPSGAADEARLAGSHNLA